jgi:hypothetical protein
MYLGGKMERTLADALTEGSSPSLQQRNAVGKLSMPILSWGIVERPLNAQK